MGEPMATRREDAPKSESLFYRAQRVMPDGNSRYTIFFPPHPPYAASGQGFSLVDVEGVERIDFINNYSSLIHGHRPPAVVDALKTQIEKLFAAGLPTDLEVEYAEQLCDRIKSVEHIRFTNSGTEAVMLAIKAARAYTGKPKIAKIEGAFHGGYDAAEVSLISSPDNWGPPHRPSSTPLCHGTPASMLSDVIVLPQNDVHAARELLRANADVLAGVIIDPLPSRLSFCGPSTEFLLMLREECDRANALLLFDEVYSLRLGYGGAQEALDFTPDITALGKIIGGGLPVGAVGGRREYMSVFRERDSLPRLVHGGTYNANPLTLVAGKASMNMFTKESIAHLEKLGRRLREGMQKVLDDAGVRGAVRGRSSLVSLRFSDKPVENYRDIVNDGADMALAQAVHRGLLDEGVLCTSSLLFILSTPMDDAVIDATLEKFEAVLKREISG